MSNELSYKGRSAPKQVTGKLREALLLMAHQGKTYQEAGSAMGFHAKTMRKALAKPWALKFLKDERSRFLAVDAPRNAHRLVELRENETNPAAAVRACMAIEDLRKVDEQASPSGSGGAMVPGFVIVIVPPAPTISGTVIEAVTVRQDEEITVIERPRPG